ncbi:MAG: peptidoglycan DD-metalloendopeptidase family protein [Candidatus Magasanikbacteria bacterium]|jgi:murein DD-endopeptidase MepM/ murein hydrolase activator NlpD
MKLPVLVIITTLIFGGNLAPILALAQTGGNTAEIDALNTEIAKRKDTIKQLEETMGKYQKNVEKYQLEARSLKNQIKIYDNSLARIDAEIDVTLEKMRSAQLEIEALDLSIQDKEVAMSKQKNIVAAIIRDVYKEDQKNYLEIMMTNDNFSDFYNQVRYLENVYTDLGKNVKTMRLIKEAMDEKREQVKQKHLSYETLKIELENKRKDLTDQTTAKQNLLNQTKSSEQKFKTLLSSLKQQYQSTEGEIRNYEKEVSKRLEQQDKIQADGDFSLSWPVSSRYITATFHDPDYPFRNVFEHSGVDIRASQGTALRAAGAGYVGRAKRCALASCYSYVLLVHTGEISTLYGHMSSISVSEDQFVNKGDVIGYSGGAPGAVGSGPFVTGAHLHFEVRKNGIPVDPMNYLIQ